MLESPPPPDHAQAATPVEYESPAAASPASVATAAIGVVGLRLMGIWLLINTLVFQPYVYTVLTARNGFNGFGGLQPAELPPLVVHVVSSFAAAMILLFAAHPLARLIFGRQRFQISAMGLASWMTVVVAGVGLALILFTIDDAGRSLIVLVGRIYANVQQRAGIPIERAEMLQLLLPLAKVLIGAALFVRPRWIVGYWLRKAAL